MQEPSAAEVNDLSEDVSTPPDSHQMEMGLDGVAELDRDLRALTDGIAMLGRFEVQLSEYESSLDEVIVSGG